MKYIALESIGIITGTTYAIALPILKAKGVFIDRKDESEIFHTLSVGDELDTDLFEGLPLSEITYLRENGLIEDKK